MIFDGDFFDLTKDEDEVQLIQENTSVPCKNNSFRINLVDNLAKVATLINDRSSSIHDFVVIPKEMFLNLCQAQQSIKSIAVEDNSNIVTNMEHSPPKLISNRPIILHQQIVKQGKNIAIVEKDKMQRPVCVDSNNAMEGDNRQSVTPVDISKILKKKTLSDRCECNLFNTPPDVFIKGFSRNELKQPNCLKHLRFLMKQNQRKINELKCKLAFVPMNVSSENFLLETDVCNNIMLKVRNRLNASQLPSDLTKPATDLKVIKQKLESIKNWLVQNRQNIGTEKKRGHIFEKRPVGRPRKNKIEPGNNKKRNRKSVKKCKFDCCNDLIVKKVDILNRGRRNKYI